MIGCVDMKPGDPPSLLKIDLLNIGLVHMYQFDHMTVTSSESIEWGWAMPSKCDIM
jgi:hypothetical protein